MNTLNSQMGINGAINDGETASIPYIESAPPASILEDAFVETLGYSRAEVILLVEDEAFVRKVAAEVLKSAGYRLLIAGSAVEALKICRGGTQTVDLLLADVVMPGMSGRELATEFESFFPCAKVLLMSGYPKQLITHERSTYRNAYLAKPFSSAELLQRVREALDMDLSNRA